MTDSMKFKIVWGLPSLGELEARNNLIVDTWEEEARWENDVAENTRKNKKDNTLECAKKACEIRALAIQKKKKTVRKPVNKKNLCSLLSGKNTERIMCYLMKKKNCIQFK